MADKPKSRYNFGASKGSGLGSGLSAIANKKWEQGKQEFTGQTNKPVVLERKELSDVLEKMKKDQAAPASTETSSTPSAAPAFVFGQKLSERVLQPTHTTEESTAKADFKTTRAAEGKSTLGESDDKPNGAASTAERLKADAEQYSKDLEKDSIASTSVIEVKTGEENDRTIHQFSCKIHSFEPSKKQWMERGLSSFKINHIGGDEDAGWTGGEQTSHDHHYRIVARTFGTMKLIINSPVFADMVIEKMDERRIKITAVSAEGGPPQIFLLTLNLAKTDTVGENVYVALTETRDLVKRAEEKEGGGRRKRKREEEGEKEEAVPEAKKAAEEEKEEEKEEKKEEEEEKEEEKEESEKEKEEEKEESEKVAVMEPGAGEDEKSLDASVVTIRDKEGEKEEEEEEEERKEEERV